MNKEKWEVATPLTDKPNRLRAAILTQIPSKGKLIRAVTPDDVAKKYMFLGGCTGHAAFEHALIANGPDVEDWIFKRMMKALNSYL